MERDSLSPAIEFSMARNFLFLPGTVLATITVYHQEKPIKSICRWFWVMHEVELYVHTSKKCNSLKKINDIAYVNANTLYEV